MAVEFVVSLKDMKVEPEFNTIFRNPKPNSDTTRIINITEDLINQVKQSSMLPYSLSEFMEVAFLACDQQGVPSNKSFIREVVKFFFEEHSECFKLDRVSGRQAFITEA